MKKPLIIGLLVLSLLVVAACSKQTVMDTLDKGAGAISKSADTVSSKLSTYLPQKETRKCLPMKDGEQRQLQHTNLSSYSIKYGLLQEAKSELWANLQNNGYIKLQMKDGATIIESIGEIEVCSDSYDNIFHKEATAQQRRDSNLPVLMEEGLI